MKPTSAIVDTTGHNAFHVESLSQPVQGGKGFLKEELIHLYKNKTQQPQVL